MLSVVKQFVRKELENKMVGKNVVNDKFNGTISANSELYPILPSIAELDGSSAADSSSCSRIGDKVRPRSFIVRGSIQYDDGITGVYIPPSTVRVMILSNKKVKTNGKISTDGGYASLLKDATAGTSVGRPYGGGAYDNFAPINESLFKVHYDKKFKMRSQLYAELGNSGQSKWLDGTQPTIHFKVKIQCPATLNFDDTSGDDANNFAPFFCFGAVCDDGASAWSANAPYRVRVHSILKYEDA